MLKTMNPVFPYKNNGAVIIALFLAICLMPIVNAATQQELAAKKFTDQIPTYLTWQSTNISDIAVDSQGVSWYGSFVYSSLRNQVSQPNNFRMNNVMSGLVRAYFDDPSGVYTGNKTILYSAVIGGDSLARNQNISSSKFWGDYANSGFVCLAFAETTKKLIDNNIVRDDNITFDIGRQIDFTDSASNFNYFQDDQNKYLWLDFNQANTTSCIDDVSGNGNAACTITNATFNSGGVIGGSVSFNGFGSVNANTVQINASLTFSNGFTFQYWANPSSNTSRMRAINHGNNVFVSYWYSSSDSNAWCIVNNATGSAYAKSQTVSKTPGVWSLVTCTYNGSAIQTYVNGVATGGPTTVLGGLSQFRNGVRVGADGAGTAERWNGSIDEVLILNRSLSQSEVQAYYNKAMSQLQGSGKLNTTASWTNTVNASLVNYRSLINNTNDVVTFTIVNFTNNSFSPYDINGDGIIDGNFTVQVRFNDSISDPNGFNVYVLNNGSYILLGNAGGANSKQWTIASFNVSLTGLINSPIRIKLSTESVPSGNVSVDWVKLIFVRKYDWIDALNKTYTASGSPGQKPHVNNQELGRAICELAIYNINNDSTKYSNFNETLYRTLNTTAVVPTAGANQSRDGIYYEWNEKINSARGCTFNVLTAGSSCFIGNTGGYDSNYQYVSMSIIAQIYNNSALNAQQRALIVDRMNKSAQIMPDLVIFDSVKTKQVGYNNRAVNAAASSRVYSSLDAFNLIWAMPFSGKGDYFDRWINLTNTYMENSSYSGFSDVYEGGESSKWWTLYDLWRNSSAATSFPIETNARFLHVYNESGLATAKTTDFVYYMSSKGSTPSGGIIADVFRQSTYDHLYSGEGQSNENNGNSYGLGLIVYDTNCSNAWDTNATVTVLSTSYPFEIRYSGNLRYVNQTTCGVSYNTTYLFYDNYIRVNQTTSNIVEVQLWPVNAQNIGSGNLYTASNVINNSVGFSTVYPINFVPTYNDSTNGASYGTVDKINGTGSSFLYFIGTENQSMISVQRSGNTVTITNNFTENLTGSTMYISTGGIVPSSPRITYPNGSSEYPSYLYDSVGGTITFSSLEVQPGVTTIELDGTTPVQNICSDSLGGLGELANWLPIIALVVGAAIVFGALMYLQNGSGSLLQIGNLDLASVAIILVGTTIIISVGMRVLVGILC